MVVATLTLGLTYLLVLASLFAPVVAWAQPTGKVHRVGYLTVPSRETAEAGANAFRDGMRALGWIGGQNLVIE
jgi:hypothetical protein